jgi:hypothetical protein
MEIFSAILTGGTRTRSPSSRRRSAAAPFIYPHLATAKNAIDVTLRHALEAFQQKVVNTLAGTVLPNFKECDGFFTQLIHS